MVSLIRTLEQAEAGSRELDRAICIHLFPDAITRAETFDHEGVTRAIPRWTLSVDAALTLIPEGAEYEIAFYPSSPFVHGKHRCMCVLWPTQPPRQVSQFASTLPLAICIAALRSRVADNGEG